MVTVTLSPLCQVWIAGRSGVRSPTTYIVLLLVLFLRILHSNSDGWLTKTKNKTANDDRGEREGDDAVAMACLACMQMAVGVDVDDDRRRDAKAKP